MCTEHPRLSPATAASLSTNGFTKDGKTGDEVLHTKPQGRMDSVTSPVPPERVVECAHLSSRRQRAARLCSPPPPPPSPTCPANYLSDRPQIMRRASLCAIETFCGVKRHAEEIPFEDKDRAQNGGARAARPPFPRWALTTHHSVHSEASSSRHVSGLARV